MTSNNAGESIGWWWSEVSIMEEVMIGLRAKMKGIIEIQSVAMFVSRNV